MLGNGAIAEQALAQLPPQFDAPLPVEAGPSYAGRAALPFLDRIRAADFSLSTDRQSVPFLSASGRAPPKLGT